MPHPAPITDADFEAADATRLKARRKALWLLALGFACLFALLLWGLTADEVPPDLSDLRVVFRHPPEEQNAYALLTKLTATLSPNLRNDTSGGWYFDKIFAGEAAWNRSVVSSQLERYPPGLADSIRAALAAPECEAPDIKSYNDVLPEICRFRSVARFLTQEAVLAWHDGDHANAAELNLLTAQLGSRIGESQGPLITFRGGATIESIAFEWIQKHADAPSITPDVLHRYLGHLAQYEMSANACATSYKLETVVFASVANHMTTADLAAFMETTKPVAALSTLPGLWQPNRTIRWHADCMRAMIGETASPWFFTSSPLITSVADKYLSEPWPRRAQNLTGRILLTNFASLGKIINVTCHRSRANLRLTQIYIAIRLYQIEHQGELPAALSELVPAYLPAVPLDPFDGLPLRYSRELTTIWSTDAERLTITDADSDLPRGMPAARLLFARPPVVLPEFKDESSE